jgi:NAD(P)-dependent dehydrogenase (short-subunit alcohol dehydrogenase family)
MATYVITGVSKGLGFEFLKQISAKPENKVVGIVRSKPATDQRVKEELGGASNITILEADLTNYEQTKKAVEDTAALFPEGVDYLLANAGYVPQWDAYDPIGVLAEKHEEFDAEFWKTMNINVLANVHLYSLFMPQILKSKVKKVICISSGMGDMDWVNDYDIDLACIYGTSKATMNMINAKFNAQYKKDGVTFLSICPGFVDVGHFTQVSEEQAASIGTMVEKFKKYSPTFTGPGTPEEHIKAVLNVAYTHSVASGHGGAYLSHFGTRQWV